MLQLTITFPFFLLLLVFALPEPDPASVQPLILPPPATISAFPEQSDIATCPLDLSEELFHGISNACGKNGQLSKSRCCPVLAAWLYSAYASTALGGRTGNVSVPTPYDLPLLPEDSESCVENLDKGLRGKGIELRRPNDTCDVVYCYCNIRLHPLSCPEAFSLSKEGKLVGDNSVKLLEKDCLNTNNQAHTSLSGCSKCLTRLYQLKEKKNDNRTKTSERKSKMHSKDCQLMGLTWLLYKNRTAYIHTVSSVLRALMMNPDGADPRSCTLTSNGLPLAVDSAEFDENSSTTTTTTSVFATLLVVSICTAYIFTLFL